MNLKTGYKISDGRYIVERVLGNGGFGITYLCEQTALSRKVAIKEFFMKDFCNRDTDTSKVSIPSVGSREVVERFRLKFLKEARAIAALNHKHIIRIIDIFEENGTAYYVMEYAGGGSLCDKVKSGALSETDAVRYIRQVASALKFIHSKRMMHLDIKPANILLNDDDEAVLIDFGLAKQYDDSGTQTSTTPVGISHGYAPMEQYRRGGVKNFSPATDIYSLGATLYKLVTGQTPPEAGDIINDGLSALPSHLSAPVCTAIEAAMQPQVKKRPQSIEEFVALLSENDNEEILPSYGRQNDNAADTVISSESSFDKTIVKSEETQLCHFGGETLNGTSEQGKKSHYAEKEVLPPSCRLNDNAASTDILRDKLSSNKRTTVIIVVLLITAVVAFFCIKSCNDSQTTKDTESTRLVAAEQQQREAELRVKEKAEQQRLEEERIAKEHAASIERERKAQEEAERKAKEEAELLAKEKTEQRRLKAEQKAKEEIRMEEKEVKEEHVFEVAEEQALFPGGSSKMFEYLRKNIKYPAVSRNNGSQGRTILYFIVEKDGSISNVGVKKSSGDIYLDKEAVRVVESMPKWIPAKQAGKTVRCIFTLPINFKLQ